MDAKALLAKFKENKENVFGLSSVLGFVITAIYTAYAIWYANWDVSFNTVVVTLSFVILFLFMMNMYMLRRFDKMQASHATAASQMKVLEDRISLLQQDLTSNKNIQTSTAKIFHNFCHEYRKRIYTLYCDLRSRDCSHFEHRESSFQKFLLFFMTNIKEMFDILTGDECAVCIKLVKSAGHGVGEYRVKTYMRDPVSYRQRSETDRALADFPYHENTAFKCIVDGPKSYFFSNNLQAERTYVNRNPAWASLYNAAIVVPIRLVTHSDKLHEEESSNVLGFLCVDNMKGNFDEMVGVNILASFADLSFYLFYMVYELSKLKELAEKKSPGV